MIQFPCEIKIKKSNIDKDIRANFKQTYSAIPRNMKVKSTDFFIISAHDESEYAWAVAIISEFLSKYLILFNSEIIFDYCEEGNIPEERIFESLILCCKPFIVYGTYLTNMNLMCYLESNDTINLESFVRFNMNELSKEYQREINDIDVINEIILTATSSIVDISMLSRCVEICRNAILKKGNPDPKDIKVYLENGQMKCLTKNQVLTLEYIKSEYNIELDGFADFQIAALLIVSLQPKRVVLYSSLSEMHTKMLKSICSGLESFYSDYKIFTAEEEFPV